MQIINAAADTENSAANAQANENEATNPAINFGQYHQEFGYQPINKDDLPAEVPEIRVNGVLIEENEILKEVQHHPAESKRQAQVKAAEALIIGELMKQECIKAGLLAENAPKNNAAEAQAFTQLLDQAANAPKATLEEQQRFFEANRSKFTTSPLLEVRHILISSDPKDLNDRINAKDIAEQIIKQLQDSPSNFAQLVQDHSSCPSKSQGGNLGQISQGQTVPEFERALFSASEGLVTYPIESRYGYHVAMIDRKVEGKELPFDYVQDKVEEYLNDKVARKATAHYIQTLIEEADIIGFNFDFEPGLMQ